MIGAIYFPVFSRLTQKEIVRASETYLSRDYWLLLQARQYIYGLEERKYVTHSSDLVLFMNSGGRRGVLLLAATRYPHGTISKHGHHTIWGVYDKLSLSRPDCFSTI
jgi:hypothetical protein